MGKLKRGRVFYAVAKGRKAGIYHSWDEVGPLVSGFPGAKHKKFEIEAHAKAYIKQYACEKNLGVVADKGSSDSEEQNRLRQMTAIHNDVRSIRESFQASHEEKDKKLADLENRISEAIRQGPNKPQLAKVGALSNAGIDSVQNNAPQAQGTVNNDKMPKSSKDQQGAAKKKKFNFTLKVDDRGLSLDTEGFVHVFTDGACEMNGKMGARAGIGVWFGHNHPENLSLPVSPNCRQTNNVAEIRAAARAVQLATGLGIEKLQINTDSKFLIQSITQWIDGWKANNWKTYNNTPVLNKTDFQMLERAIDRSGDMIIRWNHVRGHRGIEGNEEADRLAKDAVKHAGN